MYHHNILYLIILSCCAFTACVGEDEDSEYDIEVIAGMDVAGAEMGGTMVAGTTVAGIEMAGTTTGGVMAAGVEMAGTTMGGAEMAGMMVGGTNMGGTDMGGTSMGGTSMGGTSMGGTDMGGTEIEMGDPCEQRQPDLSLTCIASIYEVKNPLRVGLGRIVTVEGVVTAIRTGDNGQSHLVLQVHPASPEYISPAYSAIWVYLNDADETVVFPTLSVGTTVSVTAITADFFGQRQLQGLQAITDLGVTFGEILPLNVEASSVATNGVNAEAYEGMLVSISPVEVIEQNPLAGPGDRDPTREFVIAGGLRVNDFLTSLTPLPDVGETWEEIVGVLRLGNGDFKLEPRYLTDVGRPLPMGDASGLRINEVDYSQPGADDYEFIEIINTGSEPAPLWGVYLDLINGTNSSSYQSYHLANAADTLSPGGFLVLGSANILQSLDPSIPSLGSSTAIQNGPDGIRLRQDDLGILDELAYGDLILSEGNASVVDEDITDQNNSIGRCSPDTNNNANDFVVLVSTPGAPNSCN